MQPESKDIDQILSVLEIVNKEAIKTGIGGGLHGPADRMLNGINMLRSKQSKGPLSFMDDPTNVSSGTLSTAGKSIGQGVRGLSNYKAELVRHNIVTRTDLMKLYHPPLKKSQLPHKDPFLMRQIVPRPGSGKQTSTLRSKSNNYQSYVSRDQDQGAYATVSGAFPNKKLDAVDSNSNNVTQNMYQTH